MHNSYLFDIYAFLLNYSHIRRKYVMILIDELIHDSIYTIENLNDSSKEYSSDGVNIKEALKTNEFFGEYNSDKFQLIFPIFKRGYSIEKKLQCFCIKENLKYIDEINLTNYDKLFINLDENDKKTFIFLYLILNYKLNNIGLNIVNYISRKFSNNSNIDVNSFLNPTVIIKEKSVFECGVNSCYRGLCIDIKGHVIKIDDVFYDYELNKNAFGKCVAEGVKILLPLLCANLKDFPVIYNRLINQLENFDLIKRKLNGETLESIGNTKGVTRERIRQIIKKDLLFIKQLLEIYLYGKFGANYDYNALFIDVQSLFENFSIEDYELIEYVIKTVSVDTLEYNSEFASIIDSNNSDLIDVLKQELVPNEEKFSFSDKLIEIDHNEPRININAVNLVSIDNYYNKYGFNLIGDDFISRELCGSKVKMLEYIVREYYPDGVDLNDESFLEIADYAEKDFGFRSPNDNIDNWRSKISDDLILWGQSKINHIDNVDIDYNSECMIINTFRNYVENRNNAIQYVSISDFLNDNKDILEDTPLNDTYKLYGFLRYYLKDDYYFKKSGVRSIDSQNKKLIDIIVDDIKNVGVISRNDLYKRYSRSCINNTLELKKELIATDKDIYHIEHKPLDNNFIDIMDQILDDEIKQYGFVTQYKLYENNKSLVNKYSIDDSVELFSLLKYYLMDKYTFNRPYIQEKGTKLISLYGIVDSMLKKNSYLDINEITAYFRSQGLWSMYQNIILLATRNNEKIFKVDKTLFTFESRVNIYDVIINKIDKEIETLLANRDYIFIENEYALEKMDDSVLIGNKTIKLNIHLIYFITKKYLSNKYNCFDNIALTSLIDETYIIAKKGIYKKFEDIVCDEIVNNYKGLNVSKRRILLHLIDDLKVTKQYIPLYVLKGLDKYLCEDDDGIYMF